MVDARRSPGLRVADLTEESVRWVGEVIEEEKGNSWVSSAVALPTSGCKRKGEGKLDISCDQNEKTTKNDKINQRVYFIEI